MLRNHLRLVVVSTWKYLVLVESFQAEMNANFAIIPYAIISRKVRPHFKVTTYFDYLTRYLSMHSARPYRNCFLSLCVPRRESFTSTLIRCLSLHQLNAYSSLILTNYSITNKCLFVSLQFRLGVVRLRESQGLTRLLPVGCCKVGLQRFRLGEESGLILPPSFRCGRWAEWLGGKEPRSLVKDRLQPTA